MRITSTRNPTVQYVRSLDRPANRSKDRVFLAEGVRLVSEALATGGQASLVLADPTLLSRSAAGATLLEALPGWTDRLYEVDGKVLSAAAQTETPSGVLAVLKFPDQPPLAAHSADRLGVVLDGLADPGNAGTILRSAAAFGAGWVATIEGSVDLFAPKVVRAGMGAHFRLPIYPHVTWPALRAALPAIEPIAIDSHGGEGIQTFHWPAHTALVVGAEARGLSSEAQSLITCRVRIPMQPGVESLNAAVAASIALYSAGGSDYSG